MSYGTYTGTETDFYEASPEVAEVVNLAIRLGRPILVEGEAGCGKTCLALSIAAELGLGRPVVIRVKSTTQARDLLYRFDALRRLQEVQDPEAKARARWIYPYIDLQPLGRAIHERRPCVVLIDEIDKADIDFPNDLLDVLEEFEFDIEDLPVAEDELSLESKGFGRRIQGRSDLRPIVVVTSNREKQLPEPFLRRCLYLSLQFPADTGVLGRIVRKNLGLAPEQLSEELVKAAVTRFLHVRGKALKVGADQKLPATGELLDWVNVLLWRKQEPQAIEASGDRPPYWRLLFKTMADQQAYEAKTEGGHDTAEDGS